MAESMELTAAFSPPSSPSPQTTPTMSSTELPPNLPSAWLAYMDRVQSATDKIQNVLEDRSQSNSTTMYAGECIVVERSIVVINQFLKRNSGLLKLEVSILKNRIRECGLDDLIDPYDPTGTATYEFPACISPSLSTLLQIEFLLKSVSFDNKFSPATKLVHIQATAETIAEWTELLSPSSHPPATPPPRTLSTTKLLRTAISDAGRLRLYASSLYSIWHSLSSAHQHLCQRLQARAPPLTQCHLLKDMVQMIVAAAVPYDDYSGLLKVLEELGRRVEAVIAAGRGTETEVEAVAPFFCELLRFTENVEEEVVFVAVMRAGAGSSAVKARVVREWKVLCKAVRELSEGVLCSVVEGRLKMGVKVRQYGKHSVLAGSGDGIF